MDDEKGHDDDSPVVHIAHLAVLLGDLLQDAPRDLREVPCAAAVLCKHSGPACDETVDDWHLVLHTHTQKKREKGRGKKTVTQSKKEKEKKLFESC